MNGIDRIGLIDLISSELQSRMTYTTIETYLKGHGIDCTKTDTNQNSKRLYSQSILSEVNNKLLFKIADELKIKHNYFLENKSALDDSPIFWKEGYFRLFLSHLSKFKVKAAYLQTELLKYGISSFVAHNDIEPTKLWQIEIEKALFTMDALIAILMPGFKESNWTDQEVGVAIGREVLVIPIRKELDPYGFIGKFQGLQSNNKSIADVANDTFNILVTNPKTRTKMIDSIINKFLLSPNENEAIKTMALVETIKRIPLNNLNYIKENAINYDIIAKSAKLKKLINNLLTQYNLGGIIESNIEDSRYEEDVPF